MRLSCGETQDAAESLAAYLLRGGSGDTSYGSSDWCVAATLVCLPSKAVATLNGHETHPTTLKDHRPVDDTLPGARR